MTSGNGQASASHAQDHAAAGFRGKQASPSGRIAGAFFDLDGTLVRRVHRSHHDAGQIAPPPEDECGEFIGMVQAGLNHQLGRSEFEDLIGKGTRSAARGDLADIKATGRAALRCKRLWGASIPRNA